MPAGTLVNCPGKAQQENKDQTDQILAHESRHTPIGSQVTCQNDKMKNEIKGGGTRSSANLDEPLEHAGEIPSS